MKRVLCALLVAGCGSGKEPPREQAPAAPPPAPAAPVPPSPIAECARGARAETLPPKGVGAEVGALPRERFGLVVRAGGAAYVVLGDAEAGWSSGTPALLAPGEAAVAAAPVVAAALPESLRAWQGRAVALFPAEGEPCETRVVELVVMTGGDARWLAGRVEAACEGALWGRADDKNVVPRASALPNDATRELTAAGLERFRALKGYAAVQRDFAGAGHGGAWDAHDGAAPRVAVFHDRKVGRSFVAVAASAGAGCGEFYGELWALFQVVDRGGKQELVLLTDESSPGELFFPAAVADVDADGDVEFIAPGLLVRLVGATYRAVESARFPSHDCPC